MTRLRKLGVVVFFVISVALLLFSLTVVGMVEEEGMRLRIVREEYQKLRENYEELAAQRDELKTQIAEKERALTEAIGKKETLEGFVNELEVRIEELTSSLEEEKRKGDALKKEVDKLIEKKADIEERHKMELALLEEELRMTIARHELQVLAMTPAQDPTMFTGRVVTVHPPDYLAIGIHELVAGARQIELFRRGKMVKELSIKGVPHATLLLRIPPGVSLDGIKEGDEVELFLLPDAEDIMAFLENGEVRDVIPPNFLNVDLGTAASLWPDVSIYRHGALVGRIVPEEIYLSVIMEAPDVRGIRRGDEVKIIR